MDEQDNHRRPVLWGYYLDYLDRQDSVEYVRKTSRTYTQATLERLALHEAPAVRRAAVLALGFFGSYDANPIMGRALHDEDPKVRILTESAIRDIWVRAGNDDERRELRVLMRLNSAQHFDEVIRRASVMIERSPRFAEVWNQRAIAHYSLKHYLEAIHDCHATLELNPYHFPAASGMGQAYLEMGNRTLALESFRRALRLNPDLEAVRVQVARLAQSFDP